MRYVGSAEICSLDPGRPDFLFVRAPGRRGDEQLVEKVQYIYNDDDLLALTEEAMLALQEEDVMGWFKDCGYA
jgi:hypothetical protein